MGASLNCPAAAHMVSGLAYPRPMNRPNWWFTQNCFEQGPQVSPVLAQHRWAHTFRASIALPQRSSDSGTGMPAFSIAAFRSCCSSAGTFTCAGAACHDILHQAVLSGFLFKKPHIKLFIAAGTHMPSWARASLHDL